MVHPEGYKEAANPDYGRKQRRIGDSGWWEKVGKWKKVGNGKRWEKVGKGARKETGNKHRHRRKVTSYHFLDYFNFHQ